MNMFGVGDDQANATVELLWARESEEVEVLRLRVNYEEGRADDGWT